MNISPLRRTIIKESIIFASIAVVIGGGLFFLMSMRDDNIAQTSAATSAAQRVLAEQQGLESKFTAIKNSMSVYDESVRLSKSPGLFLDGQAVRDLFSYYQEELFLIKISMDMQPIAEIAGDPQFVRKNFMGIKTAAKVKLEVLTDEDLYALIHAMQAELPGFVNITSLVMTKTKPLSPDMLAQVSSQGTAPLISIEMGFDWYGMKSTDAESPMNVYVPKKREGAPK